MLIIGIHLQKGTILHWRSFSNKIMAKTEYGGSLELGMIEIGSLFRFNSNYIDYKSDINWQTYALLLV